MVSPANAPTIRIRRTDTQALVVTDDAMTEQGDGCFSYTFAPVDGLEYSIRADGDPTAAGQTTAQERYAFGSLSGTTEARLEVDIPAILVDTGTTLFDIAEKIRKVTSNRVVVNGTDTQVDVYEDNGTTIAFSFTISADRRERTPI